MSSGSDSWGSLGFVIVVIVQRLDFRLEWDGMTLRNELKLMSSVTLAPLKKKVYSHSPMWSLRCRCGPESESALAGKCRRCC
jgi:hypothetical protein